MKITKVYVENFGCLKQYQATFNENINVIEEENGFGKTTLANFIKAMFYGLVSNKKNVTENDRIHYAPWNGGKFGGYLEFTYHNKSYRIERFFGEKTQTKDTFKLYDAITKKESFDFSKNIGEEIFKIDVDAFMRSIYFPQNDVNWSINNTITANLTNLLEDSGDINNYDTAISKLKEKSRDYVKNGNKGKIPQTEDKIKELTIQAEQARLAVNNIDDIKNKLTNNQVSLSDFEQKLIATRQKIKIANHQKEQFALQNHYHSINNNIIGVEKELENIKQFFHQDIISENKVEQMQQLYVKYNNTSEEIKRLSSTDYTLNEYIRLKEYFDISQNIITEDVVDTYLEKSERYKELNIDKKYVSKEIDDIDDQLANETITTPTHKIIYIILEFLGLILFIPGLAFWISANDVIMKKVIGILLTIIGVALLILSTILLLFQKNKKSSRYKAISKLQKQYEQQKNKKIEKYRKLEEESSKLKKELQEFVELYEGNNELVLKRKSIIKEIIDEENNDYTPIINKIKYNLQTYNSLKEQQLKKTNDLQLLQNANQQQREELSGFVNCYLPNEINYYDGLTTIQKQLNSYYLNQQRYQQLLIEKEQFLKDNKIDENLTKDLYDLNDLVVEENSCIYKIDSLKDQKIFLEKELERNSQYIELISETEIQIEKLKEDLKQFNHKYQMLTKTVEFLTHAKEALSTTYLSVMKNNFQHYLSQIINPKSQLFTFNSELNIQSEEYGEIKTLEYYSNGYQDIVEFCARLALMESMFKEDSPCLILDDPFINYDDQKLQLAVDLLKELSNKYQIIYLICHSSRKIS